MLFILVAALVAGVWAQGKAIRVFLTQERWLYLIEIYVRILSMAPSIHTVKDHSIVMSPFAVPHSRRADYLFPISKYMTENKITGGVWTGSYLHIDLVCLFDFCCFQIPNFSILANTERKKDLIRKLEGTFGFSIFCFMSHILIF